MKHILIFVTITLLFAGCGSVQPEAPKKESQRISLIYQPDSLITKEQKYPLTLGVLELEDKRIMPFYLSENFFQEGEIAGLSQLTYFELRRSGLFKDVIYIKEQKPQEITQEYLTQLHEKYGIDMLFIGSLTKFYLFREGLNTNIVHSSIIGQIIYHKGGHIIWNGEVERSNKIFSQEQAVTLNELTSLTHNTLKLMYRDMIEYIDQTGKRMVKR